MHWNGNIYPFLLYLSLLFFSQLFVRPPQDNHFAFLHFFFLEMFLIPASCTVSPFSVHSSSGTLSDLIPWICLSLHCIVIRDLILVIPEWSSGLPRFLQFKSEFGNKEFMIWAIVISWSCFCWLYRVSPSLATKNIIIIISVLTIWWRPCVESSLVFLEEGVCYDQCVLLAELSLAFALLHSVLQGQICLLLQVFLDFLLLHSSPL